MEYRNLGQTEIKVSAICLGTMTWGEQNTEGDAHGQLDFAFERGINFIDTAELYPVPSHGDTQGRTEQFIGTWKPLQQNRDKIILASKIAGPGVGHIRGGRANFTKEEIDKALNASLKRLKTDYIDLYQIHWPERTTNRFGQREFFWQGEESFTPIRAILESLQELQQEGKIRHIGISNETPWGTMEYLKVSEEHSLPRIVSIQNPYNLLNRTFEMGLSEISLRESCGLLAYSPLAFGVLTGKYLSSTQDPNARLNLFKQFNRYTDLRAIEATKSYVELASKHNLTPATMALQFVTTRPFVTSNIIGATTLAQLEENIASISMEWNDEFLNQINKIHNRHPNPAP